MADNSKENLEKVKKYEKEADKYNASQIQVLGGLEAVRKRPGMYIGSTSSQGLHHLVWEIIDNSIDERLAGFATKIEVTINEDGSVTVQDDGRGIPVDIQEKTGRPALETVFTVLHAGGKFGGGGYKVSGGLHGVGASVVNALSTKLDVTVMRDGKKYFIDFDHGRVKDEMKQIGTVPLDEHGTIVHFYPDPDIFTETIVFDDKILKNRIRELAFLNKGLTLTFTDKRKDTAETDVYKFEGGIKEYVAFLNKRQEVLFDNQPVMGLTPKEFDLLYTMAQKPRQVFSRDQLLELVWGYEYYGEERTVDAHIKKLRQKLENIGPQVIKTVWGVGYKFDDEGND